MSLIFGALTRLFAPFVWSSPRRAARMVHGFAHAERASVIDMQQAARHTPSPARAAQYLRHAADEWRHAQLFARLAHKLDAARSGPVHVDTEHLYDTLGEASFLAFVHMGEQRGRAQFDAHLAHLAGRAPLPGRPRAVIRGVLRDEHQHAAYTGALLDELEPRRGGLVARMARRQLWRQWLRAGRALSSGLYLVTGGLLYVLCAPLFTLLRPRG